MKQNKKFTSKKIVLTMLSLVSLAFTSEANIKQNIASEKLTKTFISKHIPIVDIRTAPEWTQTGVVKDSILLTFFKENGTYDVDKFLKELSKHFDKNSTFAIICRTGNRTSMVAKFLKSQGYKNVINIQGGIKQGIKNDIKLVKVK